MKKRLAALLLVVVLCLATLPGTAFARETSYFSPLPASFDFNELRLNGSCVAELDAACMIALSLLEEGGHESEMLTAWDRMSTLYSEIELQYSLLLIRYYQDPGAYGEAYASFAAARNTAATTLLTARQTLLGDAYYGELLKLYIGSQQAAAILAEAAPDAALLELLRQENELVIRYQQTAAKDQAQIVDGQSWTMSGALRACKTDPANASAYLRVYYELYARRNAALGQIYLDLTTLRARIAETCGFADYAQYGYQQFARDYSLEDAAVFRGEVKQYLAPLFRTLSLAVDNSVFADGKEYGALGQEALLDAAQPCMPLLSDELAEAYAYMRECHLVDAAFSATKLSTTFTISLPTCGTAYVNCYRQGTNRDLSNLIHEFGHFNAFTRGVYNECYDTLEVHSQGLEMLFLSFSEALYGQRALSQSGYALYSILHSVMSGCMYDELQLYAYTTEGLTLDGLNRKSAQLAAEYGLDAIGPEGVDYSWVEIGHSFDRPMYYISYATSAFAALQFYLLAQTEGIDAAADLYLRFVQNSIDVPGYRGPLIVSEMEDPFRAGTVERFSKRLTSCVYEGLCGVPYQDTEGSWAETDIVLLYLLEILNGTSDTTFSPDGTLTRGMAVTALYRAVGKPASAVDAAAVFSDVPADTWYTDAVGWAIEAGVTDGTSETTFSPTRPVTCQEFAAMLYRQRFGYGYDYSDEPAPEGAADWAADALCWSRDEAVFRSESGPIAPTAELSRAEFAAALVGAIYD